MSQKAVILGHLKRYGAITPVTALNKYGCFRLAARIMELRESGYTIITDKASNGNATFAKYRLVA